jgi:hypothetical protein
VDNGIYPRAASGYATASPRLEKSPGYRRRSRRLPDRRQEVPQIDARDAKREDFAGTDADCRFHEAASV